MACQAVRLVAAVALATALGCGGDGDSTTPVGPSGPVNRAPETSQSIPDQTVPVGSEIRLDMQSYFTDPEGDALSYAATSSNVQVATVNVSASVVTLMAVNLGTTAITATAVDPGGLTATQTFAVTGEQPPNRAPQVSASLPDRTLTLNQDEQDTIDPDSYFSDPDGDALTFTASSSNTHVATVRVSEGAVAVVARHLGRADIRITASDPDGLSATQRFSVTVAQGEPSAQLDITKCEADGTGFVDVTIEGTVRALTRLSSVRVIGYVDTQRVGEQSLGAMAAGDSRRFAIRGSASVTSTSQCHVEFSAGGNTARAAAFMSFR